MREDIKNLICRNNRCVLATVSGTRPHCSLMSYTADSRGREIYMITLKNTQKFTNLLANPRVSLLIDTREEDAGIRGDRTKAVTVTGVFREIRDQREKDAVCAQLAAAHPRLQELAGHPDAEPFCVSVESVQLLDGITDAYFEELQQDGARKG
jgi:nitroimidazol reductase NimA-like FMN-containing flavoprotein (pyridoxamine 5'-phosphate oxidase superfamily)